MHPFALWQVNGLIQVKEEGWTGFSEGWQGGSKGFPVGEAQWKSQSYFEPMWSRFKCSSRKSERGVGLKVNCWLYHLEGEGLR